MRRFRNNLADGGMRMNGFGNCFNRGADFKRKSKLRYHIRCAGTHELCADEISVRIGNQLCNAESFAHTERTVYEYLGIAEAFLLPATK